MQQILQEQVHKAYIKFRPNSKRQYVREIRT